MTETMSALALGMARYAYRYRSVLGQIPKGSADGHHARCHGNMPADDNEEITSLPSPSAFQRTT